MKAIVYHTYGSPDVLKLEEIEKPTPQDNEVLVKVHAASANALDWHYMRGTPFLARLVNGLQKPKNTKLGADVAGRVEAVGRNVTQFQVGDDVFGCIPLQELGSFAEYVCAPEDKLALKPAHSSFEDAAAALTALQGLRDKGRIQPGRGFWWMARPVVSAPSRFRLPNRSGQKSPPCAAPGIWTSCARLAQTMSLITRARISRKAGSVTI